VWEHLVRLHQTALMALVDGEGRVLLVRRHRFVSDEWGWELPGGLVDDEEDPADGAAGSWRMRRGTARAGWMS
jgi:8-oxo-dGTP pyrophosphatase MutT (NUDIX family)